MDFTESPLCALAHGVPNADTSAGHHAGSGSVGSAPPGASAARGTVRRRSCSARASHGRLGEIEPREMTVCVVPPKRMLAP